MRAILDLTTKQSRLVFEGLSHSEALHVIDTHLESYNKRLADKDYRLKYQYIPGPLNIISDAGRLITNPAYERARGFVTPFSCESNLKCMKQIERSPKYPTGAQYAKLTRNGENIQAFYKEGEVKFNDGTSQTRLFYISDFNNWQPSAYNLQELLSAKDGFEIVAIE